jgi:hypothetical protein
MIAVNEADGLGLGAYFQHCRRSLELQIFDHRHDIAISEHIPVSVFDDALSSHELFFDSEWPLMTASLAFMMIGMTKDIGHRAEWTCNFVHQQTLQTKRLTSKTIPSFVRVDHESSHKDVK